MGRSRTAHLEQELSILGYENSLKALDWVKEIMCAENGFVRHDGSDYYNHLVAVAQDLLDFKIRDEDIITASLLHDICEDVENISNIMIGDKFGLRVAQMVWLVTKRNDVNYKEEKNIQEYLDKISEDYGASLIKTSDRKHNFGTLLFASTEKKLRQAEETVRSILFHFLKFVAINIQDMQAISFQQRQQ